MVDIPVIPMLIPLVAWTLTGREIPLLMAAPRQKGQASFP
jgi:hypothetical protein